MDELKEILFGIFTTLFGYAGVILMGLAISYWDVDGVWLIFILGFLMFLPMAIVLAKIIADELDD